MKSGGDGEVEASSESVVRGIEKGEGYKKRTPFKES